jgi:hypothetical protein
MMVSLDKGVDTIKTASKAGLFRGAKHKSVKVVWRRNGGCHEAHACLIIAESALTQREVPRLSRRESEPMRASALPAGVRDKSASFHPPPKIDALDCPKDGLPTPRG